MMAVVMEVTAEAVMDTMEILFHLYPLLRAPHQR
jgi:hypothetical protein